MRLVFNCPKCRKEYGVDDKLAGRKSRCGGCGETFRIPTPTPDHAIPTAEASSESWDEPVPFFEVVERIAPQSKAASPAAPEEPVYFEDESPPPSRVQPADFAKQREPREPSPPFAIHWGLAVSCGLTVLATSLLIMGLMNQRLVGALGNDGANLAAGGGGAGAAVPPLSDAPGLNSRSRSPAPLGVQRMVTLILHGLPSDRDPAGVPQESDVTAAIIERLKTLVPNCGSVSTMSSNGTVRITVQGSTTPEALAAAIDFGRARASGDEIDVQVSPEFVESAPTGGQQRVAAPEPRRAMPPPPQPMIAANPGQALGDASFPGDDPVAKSLVEITEGDPHRRKQAVERLRRIVPDQRVNEVVRTLIPLLMDDDGFLASEAIKTLAIWKSPDGVTALIRGMDDDRFFVRKEAIRALGKIGDPRAVEPMMAHWKKDDHEVEESLKAMGPAAETGVLARIADGDPHTRRRICDILAVIGGQATLRTMQRMRPDPDVGVQVASRNAWRAIVARVGQPAPLKKK